MLVQAPHPDHDTLRHSPTLFTDLGWPRVLDALAERCASSAARQAVPAIPLMTDPTEIRLVLAQVQEIIAWHASDRMLSFGGVESIDAVLGRARSGGILLGEELFTIGGTLRSARTLADTITDAPGSFPLLSVIAGGIPDLSDLTRLLFSTFEPSGRIRDAASPELSDLRLRQTRLRARVKRQMEVYVASHELEATLQDSYYTVRDERYVLPVKTSEKPRFKGIIHGSSATGQTVFIEPEEMISSNNELLLLDEQIRREEHRVLRDRTDRVGEELPRIREAMEAVVSLDLLHARALLAKRLDASVPEVAGDGETRLQGARHPGLILKGNEVVPNTVEIRGEWQTLIVTGPNTGGKTVTLSTLGLCTLMTQAGLPIPALPGSRIAVFPRMFSLFGDAQDLERDLSTFSGHLEGIVGLLREAGPGALALIDEPLVGTEPNAGASMAIAVLEQLAERGVRGAVSTHYDRLKTLSLEDSRFQNASVGMDADTLQPTWRLTTGSPGRSSPLEMARRLGMPPAIVERAQEILGGQHGDLQRMLDALEEQRRDLADATRKAEETSLALEEERDAIRDQGEELAARSQAAAMEAIADARRDVAAAVRTLQKSGDGASLQRAGRQLDRAERKARGAHVPRSTPATVDLPQGKRLATREDLVEGAAVWLIGMRRQAVIRQVPGDLERVEVHAGSLRFTSALQDLAVDVSSAPARGSSRPGALLSSGVDMLPAEVDLRGMRVDEGLAALDRALDDALLSGRSALRVIHGHGTGAMRKACRDHFGRSRHVAEWSPGAPDEGGDGVSLVTLADV